MAGSYESMLRPLLFAQHSYPCCERSERPSLYKLSRDYLSSPAAYRRANQIVCSKHRLDRVRKGAHANDQAHSRGCCLAKANRTECKVRDYPALQKVCRKGPDKTWWRK